MADSPPRPPINKRTDEELLEDLCRELRHVGCGQGDLPLGERVLVHVREVCALQAELAKRGVDCNLRLARLAEETCWQMAALLDDCLAYPQRVPYVRDQDGIRRFLRCHLCRKAERPPEAKIFWFCEACMNRVLEALQRRTPVPGVLLFRTYNIESRCVHADADTILADEGHGEGVYGVCERCIRDEIDRRRVD